MTIQSQPPLRSQPQSRSQARSQPRPQSRSQPPVRLPISREAILAALVELPDDEIDALEDMTHRPYQWPADYRATLPLLRAVIREYRERYSAAGIARRIGAAH